MPAKFISYRLPFLPVLQIRKTRPNLPAGEIQGPPLEPRAAGLPATYYLLLPCGRALTRLRFKVFQVYFILIFIYVLVSAHHHNGKFKLRDKNRKRHSFQILAKLTPLAKKVKTLASRPTNYLQVSKKRVPFQTPFPGCLADSESASSLL